MKSYHRRLTESSKILFGAYEEERQHALEDRSTFTSSELKELEVSFPDGGGRTNPDTYEIESLFEEKKVSIKDLPEIC